MNLNFKRTIACLALLGLLALGGQAFAEVGAIDAVPAATLLLPYFAVDLDGGITTLFSVNNSSAAPQIAHVTVWTDWSIPVLDFDIYLTGYDVVTVNLADVFINGVLPQTGPPDTDVNPSPTNVTPENGIFSIPPVAGAFPTCSSLLPVGNLDATRLAHIQASCTGGPSPIFNDCAGSDRGNNIAVGYITIDNVSDCNLNFPDFVGYFVDDAAPPAFALNDNTLWGDVFKVDSANDAATGDNLVHIEADNTLGGALFGAGSRNFPEGYTFYGRLPSAAGGIDDREPLGTTWAARYVIGAPFDGTNLHCWRDSKEDDTSALVGLVPFGLCPGGAFGAPDFVFFNNGGVGLGQDQIIIFDEEENPEVPDPGRVSPPIPGDAILPCPLETQLVAVGGPAFPVSFNFGWLYLNLNHQDFPNDAPSINFAQSYVSQTHAALGRFSVGLQAIVLNHAVDAASIGLDFAGGLTDCVLNPAECTSPQP